MLTTISTDEFIPITDPIGVICISAAALSYIKIVNYTIAHCQVGYTLEMSSLQYRSST